MSVGIGAILFLVSLGYGLQKTLLERITTSESLLTLDVTEAKSGAVILDGEVIEKIKNINGVSEISPSFQLIAQGHSNDISADVVVNSVLPSYFRLGGVKTNKGNLFDDKNQENIVVSSSVAQVFGKNSDEIIGQEMSFTFLIPEEIKEGELQSNFKRIDHDTKYKVVGVIDGEENTIYLHSDSLKVLEINKFNQLKVKTKDSEIMKLIRDQILDFGLLVSSLSDTVDQANQVFRIIQIILMMFGIVALIVSAIGMFNTMTITLMERTEEIGIMKSIGSSSGAISLMFITEAAIMGFLGGVGGIGIGVLGGKIFNLIINFVAQRFGGQAVNLFYSPLWFVGVILVFSAFVGFLTGVIPARRASKIDPLDALRYK
jgi:putative ABC transport system permease protein